MLSVKTNYSHSYDENANVLQMMEAGNVVAEVHTGPQSLEELDTWLNAAKLSKKPREKIKYLENYEQVINSIVQQCG